MCLTINFSCTGHVSSVNESITLMHTQKMTSLLLELKEKVRLCVHVRGVANGTRMNAISLVHNVVHAWRNQ